MTRRVSILGVTGSIGTQAIDVITGHPKQFRVVAISATGANVELLIAQAKQLAVQAVGCADESKARELNEALPGVTLFYGPDAASAIAEWPADVVLNGIAGAAGLAPTLAALESGKILALANKESLIIGGELVKSIAKPGQIVPVDSEHSALAQCLLAGDAREVSRLVLTASGGPFRGKSREELATVTKEQALNHPTWDMGPLVTMNSATLVNKGLEVIEAHLLFDVPFDDIHVVVHPQSIVHSMVEFIDGSTIAQASPPDMRLPIALGLSWPERLNDIIAPCDWSKAQTWTFEPLDEDVFKAVKVARKAGEAGGTGPAVFNAADEVCVEAFLNGQLGFLEIVDTIEQVLDEHLTQPERQDGNKLTVESVIASDAWARARAREVVGIGGGER